MDGISDGTQNGEGFWTPPVSAKHYEHICEIPKPRTLYQHVASMFNGKTLCRGYADFMGSLGDHTVAHGFDPETTQDIRALKATERGLIGPTVNSNTGDTHRCHLRWGSQKKPCRSISGN